MLMHMCVWSCILMYACVLLSCVLWQELGRLREMQFLELSENRLEVLPVEIGNLVELQDCYLSENMLTELPDTFGKELSMLP